MQPKNFNIPVYIHEEDYDGLYDPDLNFSSENDMSVVISKPAIKITDYQIIKGLEEDILVIHTPFHTGGSVCYYLDNNKMLFSGDSCHSHRSARTSLRSAAWSIRNCTRGILTAA